MTREPDTRTAPMTRPKSKALPSGSSGEEARGTAAARDLQRHHGDDESVARDCSRRSGLQQRIARDG